MATGRDSNRGEAKIGSSTALVVRTAVVLGALFLLDVGLVGAISGGGVVSLLVGTVGAAILLLAAGWAAVQGGAALARSRALRAGLFVVLALSASAALRLHGQPFDDFRKQLAPGIEVVAVLRRLDAVYAEHPKAWMRVNVWGTTKEFQAGDVRKAAQAADAVEPFTWYGGTPRTSEEIEAHAKALARARQVWFSFRGAVGYLQFYVALDASGRVQSISKVTGHQA